MSLDSSEPHQEKTGKSRETGQSPTLNRNSMSGRLTFRRRDKKIPSEQRLKSSRSESSFEYSLLSFMIYWMTLSPLRVSEDRWIDFLLIFLFLSLLKEDVKCLNSVH